MNENNNMDLVVRNGNADIKNEIIDKGKRILDENNFFKDLDSLMNSEFREFYNKYFKDFTDTKITLLYMKLYETIQIEYYDKNKVQIEKELLAYIISNLMSDAEIRKKIIESFNNYSENSSRNKRYILDIFETVSKEKQIK